MKRYTAIRSACAALLLPLSAAADPITDSVFGEVAQARGLDPHLLYAVALTESAHGASGDVAPHPYALRVADQPGRYPDSQTDAHAQLQTLLQSYRSVDVGAMQINLRWHGHRVDDPAELLDLRTNLSVGADILTEAMASSDDPLIGIGRYYTYSDDAASRRYGERVQTFYQNLKNMID